MIEYVFVFLSLPFFITENYLLVTALIPFFSAVIIFFSGKCCNKKLSNVVTFISSILLFIYVCLCSVYWVYEGNSKFVLIDLIDNLHISLKLDYIGVVFSLLVSFLWILTSIYVTHYMQSYYSDNNDYSKFLCFLSISVGCVIFIAFSGDLFTTFIFYELLTVVTYPLITYSGTNESMIAGRYYFGVLFFFSLILFFPFMGLMYNKFHTLDFIEGGILKFDISLVNFVAVCFIMIIYGIGKSALMPAHFWLPKVMVAPTPVSALLHAVTVVKSGVFIIIRVVSCIFGINNLQCFAKHAYFVAGWLPYVAGFTIISSSLIALKQKELKKLLAYSTISQLSYIILFTSILTDFSIKIAVFQLVCHAFAKITLFFVVGNILIKTGEECIDGIHGIGRNMPINMVAFTIGALSMIGVPPAPTFWSKFLIFQAISSFNDIKLFLFITVILVISTVLNAMYFLPIIYHIFFSKSSSEFSTKKIHIFLSLPPIITAICTFIIFFSYKLIL